jgi:hypothetical protein
MSTTVLNNINLWDRTRIEEREYLENLGVDERITLKWNFNKSVWRTWTRLIWFRIGEKCRPVLGILHRVVLNCVKDVSEELATSIFKIGIGRGGSCEGVCTFTLSTHTTKSRHTDHYHALRKSHNSIVVNNKSNNKSVMWHRGFGSLVLLFQNTILHPVCVEMRLTCMEFVLKNIEKKGCSFLYKI